MKLGEGKTAATNWQSADYQIAYEQGKMRITGYMNLVKQKVATPIMLTGLRVVSAVVGNRIIGTLKRLIILVDKKTDIHFERMIFIDHDKLVMEDSITSPEKVNLECADSFSLRHVASGKFFSMADIVLHSRARYPRIDKIRIQRTYDLKEGRLEEKVI